MCSWLKGVILGYDVNKIAQNVYFHQPIGLLAYKGQFPSLSLSAHKAKNIFPDGFYQPTIW
jgi:hypothetical protein